MNKNKQNRYEYGYDDDKGFWRKEYLTKCELAELFAEAGLALRRYKINIEMEQLTAELRKMGLIVSGDDGNAE